MRPVAFAGVAALLRQLRKAGQALGLSGAVIALMSLWKAAAAVMSDLCANCAQDLLGTWIGRTGEFVVLAALFGFSMWLVRRGKEPDEERPLHHLHPRTVHLRRTHTARPTNGSAPRRSRGMRFALRR